MGGGRPPEGRVGGEDFFFVHPVGDAVEEGGVACGCYSDGFGVGSVFKWNEKNGVWWGGEEDLRCGWEDVEVVICYVGYGFSCGRPCCKGRSGGMRGGNDRVCGFGCDVVHVVVTET